MFIEVWKLPPCILAVPLNKIDFPSVDEELATMSCHIFCQM